MECEILNWHTCVSISASFSPKMESLQFHCGLCNKLFKSEKLLKQHFYQSHREDTELLECVECGKKWKNKHQLKLHIINVHVKKHCDLCNLEVSSGNYKRHMKETHRVNESSLVNNFQCKQCHKTFVRKD